MREQKKTMIEVYSDKLMSGIVAANGNEGFMNLGYDKMDGRKRTAKQMQIDMVEKVFDVLKPKENSTVVDVGCGKGGAISILASKYHAKEITGVNIDPYQLKVVEKLLKRKKLFNNIYLKEKNLEETINDIRNKDAVYGIEILTHITNKKKFLKNINNMLKVDGELVLVFTCLKKIMKNIVIKKKSS